MEDFPTHYQGNDARNLLAYWSAAWHPALIATTQLQPDWKSADFDQQENEKALQDSLILVPNVSQHVIDDEFRSYTNRCNARLISDDLGRHDLLKLIFEENSVAGELARRAEEADEDLIQDFLALGYAYLQIQLMTRQLRYSSNLNEAVFAEQLVIAANHMTGENAESELCPDQARNSLTACFDLLHEEKNSYYPVEPELVDLVLTAPTTLGASLTNQLKASHPFNLLITGASAKLLGKKNPSATARIKELADSDELSIVGGVENELPDPLLSSESAIRQFIVGHETLRNEFEAEANVFVRRRFGLSPSLPGLLDQFNYAGAVHATLDDGKFPKGSSSNIRWTGEDGQSVLAYGDSPLSADDPAAFLGLGLKIGEEIDSAHIATFVFAHWPSQTCDSFNDLLRISSYGPLLGRFVRLDDYFESIYDPGYGDTFSADEYKQPFLKQAIASNQRDPISRFTNYWANHYRLASCRALFFQIVTINHLCGANRIEKPRIAELAETINLLESKLDDDVEADDPTANDTSQSINELQHRLEEFWIVVNGLTPWVSIRRDLDWCGVAYSSTDKDADANLIDYYAINTTNTKIRSPFWTANESNAIKNPSGPIVFADSGQQETAWIVDSPAVGNIRLPRLNSSTHENKSQDPFRNDPPVGEGLLLRNEFFEILIDEKTGGIRSIQTYKKGRKNLISQQLAIRIPGVPDSPDQRLTQAHYSEMIADSIELTNFSRLEASITSHGRIVDADQTVATFRQTVSVTRGIRAAEVEVEITPGIELSNSIHHYFCSRLAWKDESSSIVANTQQANQRISSDWFEATKYFEIELPEHALAVFTGGLPFHRRVSRTKLDSILLVGKESQRKFSFGLAVDQRYPQMAALQRMSTPIRVAAVRPEIARTEAAQKPQDDSIGSWLFHFDCKNILVTRWEPILGSQGNMTGVLIRMRETEGRAGKLQVTCPLKVERAQRENFLAEIIRPIELEPAEPDKVPVEFSGYEAFQISITWAT